MQAGKLCRKYNWRLTNEASETYAGRGNTKQLQPEKK